MADFSFDDAREAGNSGSKVAGSEGSGEPGSGSNGATGGGLGDGIGNVAGSTAPDPGAPKKRRGRPRLTDEERAARAADRGSTANAPNTGGKEGVDLGFKKNDRKKVEANIAGIHMMAAILTKQPILQLRPQEGKALSDAICDVADYHNWSLDGQGGPFVLYATLLTTVYGIYVPRIVAIKAAREGDTVVDFAEAPATPGEAKSKAQNGAGKMDFSGDISSTVN